MALSRLLPALCFAFLASTASALEFKSVSAPVAILYDSPSAKGKKLYLIRQFAPLEVVVSIDGWTKIRDAEGTLAWIDKKAISDKRTVVVIASKGEIRQSPDANAAMAFETEKWVALELQEPAAAGWALVRHRDGNSGYIRANQVWGL